MKILQLVTISILITLTSCNTYDAETGKLESMRRQKFGIDEVKKRLPYLQPGMPASEVMLMLGSPAKIEPNVWLYMPTKTKVGDVIRVYFENGRYIRHTFAPMLFGEPSQLEFDKTNKK